MANFYNFHTSSSVLLLNNAAWLIAETNLGKTKINPFSVIAAKLTTYKPNKQNQVILIFDSWIAIDIIILGQTDIPMRWVILL